jgi:antitoxin component of MazEF toxin-antitoxin module
MKETQAKKNLKPKQRHRQAKPTLASMLKKIVPGNLHPVVNWGDGVGREAL